MKCKKFLFTEKGFTLVGVIVQAVIISFAMIGLHIGIIFCEKELSRNNHRRAVYLLASGFMEEQVYYFTRYHVFRGGDTRTVSFKPDSEDSNTKPISVTLVRSSRKYSELIDNEGAEYTHVEVRASWLDPFNTNRRRSIVVVEDIF